MSPDAHVFATLTAKQRETLELAAAGHSSKEIAQKLGISFHAVDQRLEAVRRVLGGISRREMVRWYNSCHLNKLAYGSLEVDFPGGPGQASGAPDVETELVFDDAGILRAPWDTARTAPGAGGFLASLDEVPRRILVVTLLTLPMLALVVIFGLSVATWFSSLLSGG